MQNVGAILGTYKYQGMSAGGRPYFKHIDKPYNFRYWHDRYANDGHAIAGIMTWTVGTLRFTNTIVWL